MVVAVNLDIYKGRQSAFIRTENLIFISWCPTHPCVKCSWLQAEDTVQSLMSLSAKLEIPQHKWCCGCGCCILVFHLFSNSDESRIERGVHSEYLKSNCRRLLVDKLSTSSKKHIIPHVLISFALLSSIQSLLLCYKVVLEQTMVQGWWDLWFSPPPP